MLSPFDKALVNISLLGSFTAPKLTLVHTLHLAQGMKALREQNIVHRDLKPGNILIKKHPTTGKMMVSLAIGNVISFY